MIKFKKKIDKEQLKNQFMKIPSFGSLVDSSCPLCKSTKSTLVTEEPAFGEDFKIVRCSKCHLIRTNPRPTADWKKKFYNSEYNGVMDKLGRDFVYHPSDKRLPAYHSILKLLKEQFPEKRTVFDIGCAAGLFVKTAKDYGFKSYGSDYSRKSVEFGNKNYQLCLFQGYAENIPFKDNSFDVVTMLQLIEHFSDPMPVMKEVHRVLKPSGVFLIETPNYLPYYYVETYLNFLKPIYRQLTNRMFLPWFPFDHLVHWTSQSLFESLEMTGFVDNQYHYVKNFRIEANVGESPSKLFQLYSSVGNMVYKLTNNEAFNVRTALLVTAVKK